jgi:hypothetical protein
MTFSTWVAIGRRQAQHADRLHKLVSTAPFTPRLQARLNRHHARMGRHIERYLQTMPTPARPN